MRFRVAAVLMLVGFATVCGRAQVRPGVEVNTELPFHRGVNLTGWFQAGGAGEIQFTKFTRQDLVDIKSLGCDVIRLPINLHFMTDGEPNYTLDPLFLHFLDQVVDWCEELELHLILDNHTFDVDADTDPNIGEVLEPVWTQMAEHYKDRSTRLYYEILNEPHGITDAQWGRIQEGVILAIRAVDKTHPIVVSGAGWGSYNNLDALPRYDRAYNLIYSFHFYDPFLFSHQGASWTSPSMVSLAGVPFPYGAGPMPVCPPDLKGTWIESGLSSYQNEGTVARVKALLDVAVGFRDRRLVPVFCGELGVYRQNSDNEQRAYWYEEVRKYLETKSIAWTSWDYQGGFGLFNRGSNEQFKHDLNLPVVEALGLTAPEQTPFVATPDLTGFDLYTDHVAAGVSNAGWRSQGTLDFYCDAAAAEGDYCIYCADWDQYNAVGFDFKPDKDLTWLAENGGVLEFWVRGDTPGARLELRFMDTQTDDPQDHPWRMGATLDAWRAPWDGQWHLVEIPLRSFVERGAWDGAWSNPRGAFDWSAVDEFQIVSEYHDLAGMQFWFDNIRIASPPVTR